MPRHQLLDELNDLHADAGLMVLACLAVIDSPNGEALHHHALRLEQAVESLAELMKDDWNGPPRHWREAGQQSKTFVGERFETSQAPAVLAQARTVAAPIGSSSGSSTCRITSGSHAGRKFKLRPWQKTIIRGIYRTDKSGKRVVRQALICLPRKNGKSATGRGARACATSPASRRSSAGRSTPPPPIAPQATLVMKEMVALVRADPELSDRIIIREHAKTLEDAVTRSTYAALSSDHRKAHGLGPSVAVMDELAQWRGRELYDNLITGTGSHDEPLIVCISHHEPRSEFRHGGAGALRRASERRRDLPIRHFTRRSIGLPRTPIPGARQPGTIAIRRSATFGRSMKCALPPSRRSDCRRGSPRSGCCI